MGVRWQRRAAAVALAAGIAGGTVSIGQALTTRTADAADTEATPLRLSRALPSWLAPGARWRAEGWAGAEVAVRLLVGGRQVAHGRTGRLGRFTLSFRAPLQAGRHRVAIVSAGRRVALPPLLVRPVVLAAVGDVNLGDQTAGAIRSYGLNFPWTSAAPLLRVADVAIANLECAISARGEPAPKEYTFRGHPAATAGLRNAGIDAVSLANNHSLDFGADAFLDTIRHLRRNGVEPFGGGRDLAAAHRAVTRTAGGLRLAFLGYSDVRPAGFDATSATPGTARADLPMVDDIRRARRTADVVVVYFHWGEELAGTPDTRQRSFAATALAAGATVVLGAHPHVLQPVERTRRRLVAWSLGNFVFAARSAGTTETGILTVGLDVHGVRWSELVPARIEGVRPLVDGERAARTLERLQRARASAVLR